MVSAELILCGILIFYVFSLAPSLSVPFIIDDIDHFHLLKMALENNTVMDWIFRPHNEHVVPFIKGLYLINYHFFGLNPEFFHACILAACTGTAILIYQLTQGLTKSKTCAFIALGIFTGSHLIDNAIFVGTNSHIIFCMFFFLLLFYALWQYSTSLKKTWRFIAFLSTLILPSTFALGLTSFVFIVLFNRCCLNEDQQYNLKKILPLLGMTWALTLCPYIYGIDKIIHADHYTNGGHTLFEIARFALPLHFLSVYVGDILLPSVLNNIYLALGLLFLCALSIFHFPRQIAWKQCAFFIMFGLFNNFIIFIFRSAWGIPGLQLPRYFVFPLVMIALVYPLLLEPLIRNNPLTKKFNTFAVALTLSCLVTAEAGLLRYQQANRMLNETMVVQSLFINFKKAFMEYTAAHPEKTHIALKNGRIGLPEAPLLHIPNGPVSYMLRYPSREIKFLSELLLPAVIYHKIQWSKVTDPDFSTFLKTHDYLFLAN